MQQPRKRLKTLTAAVTADYQKFAQQLTVISEISGG